MLNRVVQKRDEVQKLNRNFSTLLEQDAKRQGTEGTNNIPNLSPQELKEKFHSVNKDYMKMAKSISANAQLPDQFICNDNTDNNFGSSYMALFQLLFIESLRGRGFVSFVLCVCMSFCFVLDLLTEYIFTAFATFAYKDTQLSIINLISIDFKQSITGT